MNFYEFLKTVSSQFHCVFIFGGKPLRLNLQFYLDFSLLKIPVSNCSYLIHSSPQFLSVIFERAMTTLDTPHKDPRRLSFSSHPRSSFGHLLQSPYTPRSLRPSTSRLSGTPQPNSQPHSFSGAIEPSEEAEAFAAGGLQSDLREIVLSSVSVVRTAQQHRSSEDVGLDFVAQIAQGLSSQRARSDSLYTAPSIRPSTRRQISVLRTFIQLELDTWDIISTAWNVLNLTSSDLLTRRLQLSLSDEHLLTSVQGVSKLQHAISWLERKAADELKRAGGSLVNPLEDPAYRWAYTTSRLGDKTVSVDFPLLSDEDPLDDIERKAETRLAREVFRLIRAGMLEDAEQVCRDAGQSWRAAAISGGKGAASLSANGVRNVARRVWRKAAAAIASSNSSAIPKHERAVCALFAGVPEPLLAVCLTYDDQLWARLCILYDKITEASLSGSHGVTADDDAILLAFRECKFSSEGVTAVHPEVLIAIRRLQGYLALGPSISKEHQRLLFECLASLAKLAADHNTEWACRLAAQISLFFKFFGCLAHCDLQDPVLRNFDATIQTYVGFVISNDDTRDDLFFHHSLEDRRIICHVAASLLAEMQDMSGTIATFSGLLHAALRADLLQEAAEARRAKVEKQSVEVQRSLCLDAAIDYFRQDTARDLLLETVDKVWRENFEFTVDEKRAMTFSKRSVGEPSLERVVDKDDMVIRAIEFLMFYGCPNYDEALRRTVCAIRRFFLLQKRETARRLVTWLPQDVLHEVSESKAGFLREFYYWGSYFYAVTAFNEWNTYTKGNKPPAIPESVRQAALAEPANFEARHKFQAYSQNLFAFEKHCEEKRSTAERELMTALLSTTQENKDSWMSQVDNPIPKDGVSASHPGSEQRLTELNEVKRCVIPEMLSMLHCLLEKGGKYEDAAGLAVLVAGEDYSLHRHFGAAEMKSFLKRVAGSAVKMAQGEIQRGAQAPYIGCFFEDFDTPRERPRVKFAE